MAAKNINQRDFSVTKKTIVIGLPLYKVADIIPEKNENGDIYTYNPTIGYANPKGLELNPYGDRLFCNIKLKELPKTAGVYAIVVDGGVKYIGQTKNLLDRWGVSNYGHIPRGVCYKTGQTTNCHVNSEILNASQLGANVELYFYETLEHRKLEKALMRIYKPEWNHNN